MLTNFRDLATFELFVNIVLNLFFFVFYIGSKSKNVIIAIVTGGVAEYRSSEGKTVQVPYRGDVNVTVLDILGGLRSACTYTGAAKLKELPRRATFIHCTQQLNTVYS